MEDEIVIHTKMEPFRYDHVSLRESHWNDQLAETAEYYLAVPDGDLLHLFRRKAGLPTEARGLPGWYSTNCGVFGQILGALAKMYVVLKDGRLKEKALNLFREWGKCADRDPSVLENDTYVFDKLLGGFLDLYEYLGEKGAEKYISELTDAAIGRFDRGIRRDGLQDAALCKANMIEWYTLPENLYRAYELTGDEKYRKFAEVWDYDYFFGKLNAKDFRIGPRHAYSHVNSLSSAARAYEVTADPKYLTAAENGYDEILARHTFATGGFGPAECLFPDHEGYLGDSLKSTWDDAPENLIYTNFGGGHAIRSDTWGSCEVSCCSWAVFKLCGYLLRFTGEAKYAAWAEKLLYNGTGAQLPVAPGGKVMYYASYFLDGALKTVEDRRLLPGGYNFRWQCCTGTFPQDVAEYANLLYYSDEEGIFVSQYLPSRLSWRKDGAAVEIENDSQYPETSRLRFRITAERPTEFALRFRVPSWASGANRMAVNGERTGTDLKPDTWACLNRTWNDGDLVELDFPFSLYFRPVDEKNPEIMALNYGPLVLAADEMTEFVGDAEHPEEWIHPAEGRPLEFLTEEGHTAGNGYLARRFVPFYKIPEMKWYYMYFRVHP